MESEPGIREPRRVVVASYDSYPEAQRAVDYLSDERFPVERVAIVAEDLRLVEQVTGRRGYGQAALQGAGSGALIGLIFGFFLGLFNVFDPLISALSLGIVWLIYGAIIGLIVGLIGHALSGGQRDFSSIGGIQAGRYNVMADEEVVDEASQLLAGLGSPPESQRTGEVPLSEERPERREAAPSSDIPREVPPSGEEWPERRRETPATDTPREEPPAGEERPERRTP